MNGAHIHLILNHLPIVGMVFATLTLLAGFLLKNITVKQTALGLFVLTAITALPAYFTGEGAEEMIEGIPGVSHQDIHHHEDEGKIFLIVSILTGILALATLWLERRKNALSNMAYVGVFLAAGASLVMGQKTGSSGGEIRHTEIRSGASVTPGAEEEED
ncbi:MAG: hypothetical protein KJS92_09120 [Bacteroidetes bacterium]|nr:hypothetical protein [Bacteroidota bacterium]